MDEMVSQCCVCMCLNNLRDNFSAEKLHAATVCPRPRITYVQGTNKASLWALSCSLQPCASFPDGGLGHCRQPFTISSVEVVCKALRRYCAAASWVCSTGDFMAVRPTPQQYQQIPLVALGPGPHPPSGNFPGFLPFHLIRCCP